MAEIIKKSELVTDIYYEREFNYEGEPGCGYSFPCDKDGNLSADIPSAALENYDKCIREKVEWNGKRIIDRGIRERKNTYRVPAELKCNCGEVFPLIDEYLGACECPFCGQWYSLSGQELLSPDMWEEDY